MKVLVTGGAGYIGTELATSLNENPSISEIVIYDNLMRGNYNLFIGQTKQKGRKLRFVKGELLDTRKLKEELEGIDIVYHLAAKVTTPFADQNPHEFEQVNHWGTAELIYAIEESNVKQFIYLSSTSVYGASKNPLNIDSEPNPKTFYGISKMRGEDHVKRLINSSVKTYILRCGNVYGYSKSMRFDSAINKFMFEANFNKKVRIYGNGNQNRSFIHIDRMKLALTNIIQSDLKSGIYNLTESTFSINEIIDVIKDIYPEMEMLFVNQNMKLRELKIEFDTRLNLLANFQKNALKEDLTDFKTQFTF
mgnify:CR=1 FL=1